MNNFRKIEAEGGCGVIGTASTEKIAGKHLLAALSQMRNRGNGKGGGIAASGLDPTFFGVTQEILETHYLLAIAYLDQSCIHAVEKDFIHSIFDVHHKFSMPHIPDYHAIEGLDIPPPDVKIYFVKVKKKENEEAEDEIVYKNTYRLNQQFYSSIGEKRAFVLSHGKNLLVLKMVGYGDDVIRYYKLDNFFAHVWIGHHRYPTKGKVWHPGGAHPFIGMNEALVHNGDFANYFSMCEYLAQRNIFPLFLTDTEVAVLVFDLLYRNYKYPLEYVIEALAPTTEFDFNHLPEDKKHIYHVLQKTHMHGSPDGPWFFLIAQSLPREKSFRLIGITDTSMLRPQVFALQKGNGNEIGFASSEKQAIDAVLKSLSEEDPSKYCSRGDLYWNARGGSYSDGGAFSFTVRPHKKEIECTDKFGDLISLEDSKMFDFKAEPTEFLLPNLPTQELYAWVLKHILNTNYEKVQSFVAALVNNANNDENRKKAFTVLTQLIDQFYLIGKMRRSSLLSIFDKGIDALVNSISENVSLEYAFLNFDLKLPTPISDQQVLIVDAKRFPSEGTSSLSETLVEMYRRGFKQFVVTHCHGQRFIGNGFGPRSQGVRIDVYGSSGDYLGSGIDGAEIYVHGSGQDQLAQIMKEGSLVVYGDVGQTFMYGAKGGMAFVRGNAAGRPLINAVGKPRVVINGTCLDYLAESFMAGNPLKGGGFVIVNAIQFTDRGEIIELKTPYPGSNLYSLASGGAIYLRDPASKVTKSQLNGGVFEEVTPEDWSLILTYLEVNEKLFNIPISRLLTFEGALLNFNQIYRKIVPSRVKVLQEEEAWVKERD